MCICKKSKSFSATDKTHHWMFWNSSNQLCLSIPVSIMHIVLLLLHPSIGLISKFIYVFHALKYPCWNKSNPSVVIACHSLYVIFLNLESYRNSNKLQEY